MSLAFGLGLALISAVALNWGWVAQHEAAGALPRLTMRRPVRSLRLLFRDLSWLVGFVAGLGGWALYVAGLVFAPLSLVQAVSAGGVGLLAAFAHRRGAVVTTRQLVAVAVAVVGLALLGISLVGGTGAAGAVSLAGITAWVAVSALASAFAVGFEAVALAGGAGLGLAAGALYAAGDVATKGAVRGGASLALVPLVLAAHGGAFASLQAAFQRGGALATAGTASLLTNALPIVAGIVLFHERLPGGALAAVRIVAFACVVFSAALMAAPDGR